MTQVYFNQTETPIELEYKIPTDNNYAVIGLKATLNGKDIQTQIMK